MSTDSVFVPSRNALCYLVASLFLVVRPGATNSVLAPRCYPPSWQSSLRDCSSCIRRRGCALGSQTLSTSAACACGFNANANARVSTRDLCRRRGGGALFFGDEEQVRQRKFGVAWDAKFLGIVVVALVRLV